MSILLLSNTIRQSAVDLRVTDSSDTETSDASGVETVTGGPRHLYWTQSGTSQRRIVYVNKTGGLSADYFVGTNFHRHNTHEVRLKSWSSYPSTAADAFNSSNFAETLIGMTSRDFVYSLGSLSSKQAFGVMLTDGSGGAYTKKVSQCYFAQSIEFEKQKGDTSYQPVSRHAAPVKYKDQYYHLQGVATIGLADITRSLLNSYWTAVKTEPVFFYDSSGNYIEHKLWHCVILAETVTPVFNDLYDLNLTLGILKHWI